MVFLNDIEESRKTVRIFDKRKKIRKLKMKSEQSIKVTLKGFDITKDDKELYMTALALVDRDSIVKTTNGLYKFKNKPSKLLLFNDNDSVKSILKKYYSHKVLIRVYISCIDKSLVLDMKSYNSVREIYEVASKTGHNITNDVELIKYAVNKMCPRVRYVRYTKSLGRTAFNGSSIREYTIDSLMCFDTDLITDIQLV